MINIELGGIYRVEDMDRQARSALALVTAIDAATQSVSVTLLSPDIELGTSSDLLLDPSETGVAYELLAESEIFGYVWFEQLERRLGGVSETVLESLAALQNDDIVNHAIAGPPLVAQSDPRWVFKLRELSRVQALTAHCTSDLIDGENLAVPDAEAVRVPETSDELAEFEEYILSLVELVKHGHAVIPAWLAEAAFDGEARVKLQALGSNVLRLVQPLALKTIVDGAPTNSLDIRDAQIEQVANAGRSSLRLVARDTALRGPIEIGTVRARDGRRIQRSRISASALLEQYERVAA